MRRDRKPFALKDRLVAAAALCCPDASETLAQFPDAWELVEQIGSEESPLYVVALPAAPDLGGQDRCSGLPTEVSQDLRLHRLYKFLTPWPMLTVTVGAPAGRAAGAVREHSQLQPVGQAQVWFGEKYALIWECYLNETRQTCAWRGLLAAAWLAIEHDIGPGRLFTPPCEPTFAEGYTKFLTALGYAPDHHAHGCWWVKPAIGSAITPGIA